MSLLVENTLKPGKYWMFPTGKIEYVGSSVGGENHYQWATRYIQTHFIKSQIYNDPLEFLKMKSFLRMEVNPITKTIYFDYEPSIPVSTKQMESLKNLAIENNYVLHDDILDHNVELSENLL
jgi:hypothetical protein